jgi:uncharacterized membrane protein (UPF0182 family)
MKSRVHIKFGLVTSAVLMLLTLIFYFARIKGSLQPVAAVLIIMAGVVISCFAFKKTFNEAPFNEVFFNGFRTAAIIAVLLAAFAAVFVLAIPEFKEQAIEMFKQKAIADAGTDKALLAKVNDNISDYQSRFLTMFIGTNMMVTVLAGLAGSVAGALFTKNYK